MKMISFGTDFLNNEYSRNIKDFLCWYTVIFNTSGTWEIVCNYKAAIPIISKKSSASTDGPLSMALPEPLNTLPIGRRSLF